MTSRPAGLGPSGHAAGEPGSQSAVSPPEAAASALAGRAAFRSMSASTDRSVIRSQQVFQMTHQPSW